MAKKKLSVKYPRQLVFVRELFLEAEKYASGHELELDLLKAILLIDLCVERLLNIVWREADSDYPVKGKRYPDFGELWEKVESVLKEKGFIENTLGAGKRDVHKIIKSQDAFNEWRTSLDKPS